MKKSIISKAITSGCFVASGFVGIVSSVDAQQIEEIVVTAQKRQESMQDVPISMSAVTSDLAKNSGIRGVEDLSIAVPGVNMSRQSSATLIYIRGIGTGGGQAGQEGAVATFVDGVYLPSMTGSTFSFNNIDRIEVLKGPQGTLYGRNATGGAINIITRTPSSEPYFEAEVGYGNYETTEGNFYVTGGVDNVAADLALYYKDQAEGFGENLLTGEEINDSKNFAARSKVVVDISEDSTLTFGIDYSTDKGAAAISYRPMGGGISLSGLVGWPYDHHDIMGDVSPGIDTEAWGGSIKFEHLFGDYSFTSITAYRELQQDQVIDLDLTPLPLLIPVLHEDNDQVTQEFQLNFDGENLKWMVGLFYMNSTAAYDTFRIDGLAITQQLAGLTGGFINNAYTTDHSAFQDTSSWAGFGELSYSLSDLTKVTAGFRYTADKRKLTADGVFLDTSGAEIPMLGWSREDSETWEEPTWRLAVDHQFSDSVMGYVSYNRGFKSGVYNLTAPLDDKVDPEILDAWEVGVKTDLFDRRVRFNASAFYYQYDNIQLSIIRGLNQTLLNAAEAEVYGIDSDLIVAVSDEWTVTGGFSWLKTEYNNFDNGNVSIPNTSAPFGNTILEDQNLSGYELIKAPEYTINISSDYVVPFAEGELAWNLTYFYTDSFYWEPDNRVEQEAYGLLNSQVRWTAPNGNFHVRVFGRNLTDEEYLNMVTITAGGDLANAAAPRTYGIAVGYKY